MRNTYTMRGRAFIYDKFVLGLISLFALPVYAESPDDTIQGDTISNKTISNKTMSNKTISGEIMAANAYQTKSYSDLLAAGPSFFDLPRPPLPPTPPLPRVHRPPSPRYLSWDGQRGFRSGPSLYAGWSTGGDTLKTANGSQLNAGDGTSLHFGLNMDFRTGTERAALQWAIGYRWNELKYKDAFGDSAKAKMSVIPLDTLGYFQHGHFRIGGGLTYHLFPKYTEVTDSTRTVDFHSQLGYMVAMELVGIDLPFFINVRYTYIIYKPEGGSYLDLQTNERVSEVDGSHFSINAGLHIR